MNVDFGHDERDCISRDEKNHELYLKQKRLLDTFLEKGAISVAQYAKSLHDLSEKMGYAEQAADQEQS